MWLSAEVRVAVLAVVMERGKGASGRREVLTTMVVYFAVSYAGMLSLGLTVEDGAGVAACRKISVK